MRSRIFILLFMVLLITNLFGDDVTDSIKEGLNYYEKGEYSNAIESLSYANQLIKQKKGSNLEDIFPEPLQGWTADKATSTAAGEALFGGGVSAERYYEKNDSNIQISIFTDSPLMQSMMMMFSNPMLATSDGGKMTKISGHKAIIKYDEGNKSGNIDIVLAAKYLIQISGNRVDQEDLMDYAKAIDFDKLESMK